MWMWKEFSRETSAKKVALISVRYRWGFRSGFSVVVFFYAARVMCLFDMRRGSLLFALNKLFDMKRIYTRKHSNRSVRVYDDVKINALRLFDVVFFLFNAADRLLKAKSYSVYVNKCDVLACCWEYRRYYTWFCVHEIWIDFGMDDYLCHGFCVVRFDRTRFVSERELRAVLNDNWMTIEWLSIEASVCEDSMRRYERTVKYTQFGLSLCSISPELPN